MGIEIRIKDCIDNHDKYVELLATKSDKELSKRLNLVHIQMEIADKTKNTGSLELLEVWRHQIIEARIHKDENQIPDAPNEIELAIADIETFVEKTQQRKAILNEVNNPIEKSHRKFQRQKDDDSQLTLF